MIGVYQSTKRYRTVTAVDAVSLEVPPGQTLALLGANGAGKTSLMRMIMGITLPDAGRVEVLVDGRPAARNQLGYMPEERGLYKGIPIVRILAFVGTLQGLSRSDALGRTRHWLDRVGLSGRESAQMEQLSRGNQQKVQLIASLLHDPRVLVLDEPFSGLDPLNQELFVELFYELRQRGCCTIVSGHQMDLIERVADRIVVMLGGRIILEGTLTELGKRLGAGDVYTIALRQAAPSDHLARHPSVTSVETPDPRTVRLAMRAGEPLGPVLALMDLEAVAGIHAERITLHEAYLRAMKNTEARQ
jgi:ABC-2 type transport system ATP-binding protein